MRRMNNLVVIIGVALVLIACAGVHAQEKMETRDTRIGKLVFERSFMLQYDFIQETPSDHSF